MPGGGHRWQWIGKPPLYWTIIAFGVMVHIGMSLVFFFTLPRWARSMPDAYHPVEFRMKGGHLYYLSYGMGWYLNNDIWLTFSLLAILAIIMVIHHNRIEKVR